MQQKDSFKTFYQVYYQLRDTLDDNQDLLNELKEDGAYNFEIVINDLEETLENEREKIIKINYNGFKVLTPSKQMAMITTIQELTVAQEEINSRLVKLAEGGDSFEENDSKNNECGKFRHSDTMCSEEETKEDDKDPNAIKVDSRLSSCPGPTLSKKPSKVIYDKLPNLFRKVNRH